MGKAYQIKNKKGSSLNLWKVEDGKFQIIKNGRFLNLLFGKDYILFQKELLPIFELVSDKVIEIIPVEIFRKSTQKIRYDYFEMKVMKQFTIDELNLFRKNEKLIWYFSTQYNMHLIVSEKIKLELEKWSKDDFVFSDNEWM